MTKKAILEDGVLVMEDDLIKWGQWMETSNRHIGLDHVGKYRVSTVFLGLDHGFGDTPLWFETMVFSPDEINEFTERYETLEQAKAGHKIVLEKIREAEKPF